MLLYKEIRFTLRDLIYNSRCRKKLLNNDFSLITCDCTGGCVAKDLKVRMNSPTRNFYFNADDYIKFCKNLDYYLSLTPEPYTGDYSGGVRVFNGISWRFEDVPSSLPKC